MFHSMPTDDEWADADAATDEAIGYHTYAKDPAEGVRRMQRRIAAFNERLKAVRARNDSRLEPRLIQQIREATELLRHYQTLRDGRN